MAEKVEPVTIRCPQCGEPCREASLQKCLICRSLFCPECVVEGYGREFCSVRCREYFFHGDDDEIAEEET